MIRMIYQLCTRALTFCDQLNGLHSQGSIDPGFDTYIYVHIAIPNIDRKVHSNFILVGFNGILLFHLIDSFWGTIYISLPFARLLYTCVCIVLSWLNGSGIYHHISQLLACAWLKYYCSTPGVFRIPKKSPSLDIFWTLIAIQFLSTQNDKHGDGSKPYPPVVHIKIAGKWMFTPLKMVVLIHSHILKRHLSTAQPGHPMSSP